MASSISVGATSASLADVPVEPDAISWGLMDVSASDAGRVQDYGNTMYKMRVGQKRKLTLSWTNPTLEQASAILNLFNGEYFFVRYVDPLDGGFAVREFYAGDRSSPFRQITLDGGGTQMSTLSFDIIER